MIDCIQSPRGWRWTAEAQIMKMDGPSQRAGVSHTLAQPVAPSKQQPTVVTRRGPFHAQLRQIDRARTEGVCAMHDTHPAMVIIQDHRQLSGSPFRA